ncbi:kelch-like protein 12 [Branchiostoma lanceolatum]|uniref:kelch-like protein 12 n=1 Tax=Branchiostoma lanceolatum TaxID=7740 RepID=UPI003456C395
MAAADREPHASAVRPRSYQDESYLHGFLGTVGDLQKAGVLQDVVLEVEGRRFPCHRLVLSAASPYFRAMFTSDMAESRQKTVVLQGLDAGNFGEILSYIYSGTLHVSLDKVQPLYQAADLLQLDYVRDTCSSYMAMNADRSTCVDLYKFADVFSVDSVLNRCLQWICRSFTEVASSEEFCSLSVNQLTEIISHDELDVKEETTVWEAVVRWVQHSREDRLHHLPSILPHIRFNLLTPHNMVAIIDHPLVREDPGRSVIRNVVKETSNLKKRSGMDTLEMALLFSITTKEIHYMNPRERKYITCSYDPKEHGSITAVTVTSDNNIYMLTSGLEESDQLSLLQYNHVWNVWENTGMSSVSKFLRRNSDTYEDHLRQVDKIFFYLNYEKGIASAFVRMRKYNRHSDQWQECAQLQIDGTSSYYCAKLSCRSQLYLLTSEEMHRYDPSQDRWCKRSPPRIIPEVGTAVAMRTEIFCTDMDFSQTMVYDTESDCWQKLQGCPPTPDITCVTDSCPSLFLLENQLHIVLSFADDMQKEEEDISHVYMYDRASNTWRDLKFTLPSKYYIAFGSHFLVARMHLQYLKGP